MRMSDVFRNIGRPFSFYPKFVHDYSISTNACILLCFIGWKTFEGEESRWMQLTTEEITKETGLTRKEQESARAMLVEKGLIEEYYARLKHVLMFRLAQNGDSTKGEIPISEKVESGNEERSNRLIGKELNKEPTTKEPPIGFDEFWKSYPRRVKKPEAIKAFRKALTKSSAAEITAAIGRFKACEQWTKDGGKFIPYPATWLNNEQWNDDIQPAVVSGGQPASPKPEEPKWHGIYTVNNPPKREHYKHLSDDDFKDIMRGWTEWREKQ